MSSPHIAPGPRLLTQDRFGWAPVWSERRSRSYVLSEDQAQAKLDKSVPG
jgi:hypothetical protein